MQFRLKALVVSYCLISASCAPGETVNPNTPASGVAAAPSSGSAAGAASTPAPAPLFALSYVAGPAWKRGEGPEAQDLNGHFAYVEDLFRRGILVLNGLYGDEIRGLYVFAAANEDQVRAIVGRDPGVLNGTLASDGVSRWLVMWDGLDRPLPENAGLYVLEYGPGPAWIRGRPPAHQNLKEHFDYVSRMQDEGRLLAAGPILGTEHGRYLIVASSKADAEAFVARDPGARSGVLAPVSERPWRVVHRQTLRNAASLRNGT
jgi:uncharacterized protein YciI